MNKLSSKLRELRIDKNLTQAELASKIGMTQTGIAKWEAGKREPSLDALIFLAKFFECSTDYLLGLED